MLLILSALFALSRAEGRDLQHPSTAPPRGGLPHFGARLLPGGRTRFALYAPSAKEAWVCLFRGEREQRLPLQRRGTGGTSVWQAIVPDAPAGTPYGFRIAGPNDRPTGHFGNLHKLLLDPYALALTGPPGGGAIDLRRDELYDDPRGYPTEGPACDIRDSASVQGRSLVVDPRFEWGNDRRPKTPWRDTVISELHVAGATLRHPEVPEALRGTFLGLSSAPMIDHLRRQGITAVELLPVHFFADEAFLRRRGFRNYWGYNTLGFFAPSDRYATQGGDPVREFKQMVKGLHEAGIEVILDVVFNHTAENGFGHGPGWAPDWNGPTLAFRGIDNGAYYRSSPGDPGMRWDCTGCGNTTDTSNAAFAHLLRASLGYWTEGMHVDGFRFDLAPALARNEQHQVDPGHPLLQWMLRSLPPEIKLIAEPWDVGQRDSYQQGAFPWPFREWNGGYRDTVRRFWRGDEGVLPEVARAVCGSEPTVGGPDKPASTSVNFVAVHDGFTLRDLVTYRHKRNDDNGEGNRDGTDENLSWEEPPEQRLRARMNLFLTQMTSRGVLMLLGGDEVGRTQGGNNNGWCVPEGEPARWATRWPESAGASGDRPTEGQDLDSAQARRLREYVARLTALRKVAPFGGDAFVGPGDVTWLKPDGGAMSQGDWHREGYHHLAECWTGGDAGTPEPTARQAPYVVVRNAGGGAFDQTLPVLPGVDQWALVTDTALAERESSNSTLFDLLQPEELGRLSSISPAQLEQIGARLWPAGSPVEVAGRSSMIWVGLQ